MASLARLLASPAAAAPAVRWALVPKLGRIRIHIGLYEGTKHPFATDAIRRGVPKRHLQRFLGHASVTSTRRYARLADNAMLEVLRNPAKPAWRHGAEDSTPRFNRHFGVGPPGFGPGRGRKRSSDFSYLRGSIGLGGKSATSRAAINGGAMASTNGAPVCVRRLLATRREIQALQRRSSRAKACTSTSRRPGSTTRSGVAVRRGRYEAGSPRTGEHSDPVEGPDLCEPKVRADCGSTDFEGARSPRHEDIQVEADGRICFVVRMPGFRGVAELRVASDDFSAGAGASIRSRTHPVNPI